MDIGIYQSASSLSALEKWQDAVAQNITSGQVTGYRKRTVEFSTQQAGEWQLDPSAKNGDSGIPAVFPKATNGISFTTGETQPTGRDLDVAIQGDGFFEVQLADGSKGYTRSGEFNVRTDHTLVNSANQEVLNDGGSPIVLQPDGKVTINADGSIVQGATTVGKIGVEKFSDPSTLVPISGGLFVDSGGVAPNPVAKPQLMQGYLESSNVAPLREMVNLVLISRAYDANQRVIKNNDEQAGKTIDALG
jgi:flagellar basal-body rod protein FlgF